MNCRRISEALETEFGPLPDWTRDSGTNYYKILRLNLDCTHDDIVDAFAREWQCWRGSRHPYAPLVRQALEEAYEVLSDDFVRDVYGMFLDHHQDFRFIFRDMLEGTVERSPYNMALRLFAEGITLPEKPTSRAPAVSTLTPAERAQLTEELRALYRQQWQHTFRLVSAILMFPAALLVMLLPGWKWLGILLVLGDVASAVVWTRELTKSMNAIIAKEALLRVADDETRDSPMDDALSRR